jgi:Flp pilus assembly protein TadG
MKVIYEKFRRAKRAARFPRRFICESGQSLVELALLTPLLLILVIGIAEMGRYAYFAILVGNAARAGAAYGAQNVPSSADTTDIQAAATNDCQNCASLSTAGLTVTPADVCACDNGGTFVSAPTSAYCNPPPTGTNNTAGSCATGQQWVIVEQVTVSGTFKPMFTYSGGGLFSLLNLPSLTFSSTASQRVAQ